MRAMINDRFLEQVNGGETTKGVKPKYTVVGSDDEQCPVSTAEGRGIYHLCEKIGHREDSFLIFWTKGYDIYKCIHCGKVLERYVD